MTVLVRQTRVSRPNRAFLINRVSVMVKEPQRFSGVTVGITSLLLFQKLLTFILTSNLIKLGRRRAFLTQRIPPLNLLGVTQTSEFPDRSVCDSEGSGADV